MTLCQTGAPGLQWECGRLSPPGIPSPPRPAVVTAPRCSVGGFEPLACSLLWPGSSPREAGSPGRRGAPTARLRSCLGPSRPWVTEQWPGEDMGTRQKNTARADGPCPSPRHAPEGARIGLCTFALGGVEAHGCSCGWPGPVTLLLTEAVNGRFAGWGRGRRGHRGLPAIFCSC